ncbi:MAG: hypothetical protein EZS28_000993 [Streblomastix strix]|uniref:Uncharacterized protein n=1 Tax=Streblomastix strix TaxID=222440 RepID=A0A5J4X8H9_9EUKA|nr:MAG: hypothetical protein EZS28_000993 [Streblomastix strix]
MLEGDSNNSYYNIQDELSLFQRNEGVQDVISDYADYEDEDQDENVQVDGEIGVVLDGESADFEMFNIEVDEVSLFSIDEVYSVEQDDNVDDKQEEGEDELIKAAQIDDEGKCDKEVELGADESRREDYEKRIEDAEDDEISDPG